MGAGHWLVPVRFEPMLFSGHPLRAEAGVVSGVYLTTDDETRAAGLLQRFADHCRDPARHAVFATVWIVHLHDHTPPLALDAIEGRCADLLELRVRAGAR